MMLDLTDKYATYLTQTAHRVNTCNHEIKLSVVNPRCIRNEETVEKCIKTTKVMNNIHQNYL